MASAKQLAARKKFAAIMKSGGFKKRKSSTRPKVIAKKTTVKRRKTTTTKRKSIQLKRAAPRKRTMVKRRSKSIRRRSSSMGRGIGSSLKTGMISDIIKGIGAGSLATLVVGRVAPQYAPIASIGAGFLAGGGIIGGAANLLLSGGLSSISGMFGGTASAPQQEFGV